MTQVSIVIMAFNEERSIESTVHETHHALNQLNCPYEVLIVDDGSTDQTGVLADQLALQLAGVRVVHHRENQGLGGVYRTGFFESKGEGVAFFPADGQFPPSVI